MPFVELNRQFVRLADNKPADLATLDFAGVGSKALGWTELLEGRRIVVLAEAGSGKTREIEEQVHRLKAAGEFAAYATVEDVDRDGLDGALGPTDQKAMADWRASDRPGWLFIDSIDEGKLARVRFDRVLRKIATGIVNAERRAHILFTCRLTDWEPVADLARLATALPIPGDVILPASPDPDGALTRILRNESEAEARPASPPEKPLVAVMASLDPARVRQFARTLGLAEVEEFLRQIEAANLWRFARRPLDLDWLIAHWEENRRLGSLHEMLESSLKQRVRETNQGRARVDTLDQNRAIEALERIGAALTFSRRVTIAIPDSELHRAEDERPIDLAQVLPDWSPEEISQLLTRPFFDPATYGRARLHNDNEGVVRGFLAARWLRRLTGKNLPKRRLADTLLATTYGRDLVRPAMVEAAAWCAIWAPEIGRELALRNPWILITCGDPTSLPRSLREEALRHIVASLAAPEDDRRHHVVWDGIRRFVSPEFEPAIRVLWHAHHQNQEACEFLLQLIVVGRLRDCIDLAASVAFDPARSRYTLIFAGRALSELGDDAARQGYGRFILSNATVLPNAVVVDAIDQLFPNALGVPALLEILAAIDVADSDHGLSVEWQFAKWIDRITTRPGLEQLLDGLLQQLGPASELGHVPDRREEAYFAGIAAAATELMKLCDHDEAPPAVVAAALKIERAYKYGSHHALREKRDVAAELNRTAARRRSAFWQIVEGTRSSEILGGKSIETLPQLQILAYPLQFELDDIDWLLTDAAGRTAESEQKLAVNAALNVWQSYGTAPEILARIALAVEPHPAMMAVYQQWMHPPVDRDYAAHERRWTDARRRQEQAREEREQGWRDFVTRMQADPEALRRIGPPTAAGVDGRLFDLWQLTSGRITAGNRYSISSLKPIEPALGPALTAAFQDALIGFWRHWRPKLKSERTPSEQNTLWTLDCMGIAAIGLEAASGSHWSSTLSSADARRAAEYATLEINGFPTWLETLALSHATETEAVLHQELLAELDRPNPSAHYGFLSDLSHAGDATRRLMAPALFEALCRRDAIPPTALPVLLGIVARECLGAHDDLLSLLLDRFAKAEEVPVGVAYLAAAYLLDVDAASSTLVARLANLSPSQQAVLIEDLLPRLFETSFSDRSVRAPRIGFDALAPLVEIAFRTIRIEEDRVPGGGPFTPTSRDFAERAREVALHQLVETPGQATYATLRRFADAPDCPVSPEHLRRLALDRALRDSDEPAWHPGDVVEFEAIFEAPPRTPESLQHTAVNRFVDLQHDLLHGDFAQGATLRLLPDERAVQNWVADRLESMARDLYTVERESHVVSENEPDIRLRARASGAILSIEIKVIESWGARRLELALTEQLCGQYLRQVDARHGLLLLVHQLPRVDGWQPSPDEPPLSFAQMVCRLREIADRISSASPTGPQPLIVTLDVSSLTASAVSKKVTPKAKQQ